MFDGINVVDFMFIESKLEFSAMIVGFTCYEKGEREVRKEKQQRLELYNKIKIHKKYDVII